MIIIDFNGDGYKVVFGFLLDAAATAFGYVDVDIASRVLKERC